MVDSEMPALLTVFELAEKLRVTKNTIYYWSNRNEIPYLKIGKHLRFVFEDVLRSFRDRMQPELPACKAKPSRIKPSLRSGSLKTEDASHVDLLKKE